MVVLWVLVVVLWVVVVVLWVVVVPLPPPLWRIAFFTVLSKRPLAAVSRYGAI